MPKIEPFSNEVSWSKNEGTIGVVGVAPWATLDFCRLLYQLTPASKDWHYPRVIIDSNHKIPSRGRYFDLNEVNPSPYIKATINELALAGATLAVVPCNTAHILFNEWGIGCSIPVLSIIDATVSFIRSTANKVTILGSYNLSKSNIYGRHFSNSNFNVFYLSDIYQNIVSETIESIKKTGDLSLSEKDKILFLSQHLLKNKVTTIVLACTELSLLKKIGFLQHFEIIDSNESLAKMALLNIGISISN